MRIGIDINNVLRDYDKQFIKYYTKAYSSEYDMNKNEEFKYDVNTNDKVDIYSDNFFYVFKFKSEVEYKKFIYEDHPYELFAASDKMTKTIGVELDQWCLGITNIETDEDVEFFIISPNEVGVALTSSLFFLSKCGLRLRNYIFPKKEIDVWNHCDIYITSNINILENKPEGKIAIKINNERNGEVECDYSYSSSTELFKDNEIIKKILNK